MIRAIPVFEKFPQELFNQKVDFTASLAVGETITAASVTALNRTSGADATAEILTGSPTIVDSSKAIRYRLQAGTPKSEYLISVVATLSTSDKLEQWVEMIVPADTE